MKRRAIMLALISACALPACNTPGEEGSLAAGGEGQIVILLTDAPIDMSTVQSVIVTIEAVTVYPAMLAEEDALPILIMDHPETFDLLTLTDGAKELLAMAELPVGFYSRIRLGILAARLTFLDGSEETLKIESRKVDVPISFELTVDDTMEIVLDFDAGASVQVNLTASDKYILRPVVTPVAID